MQTLKKIRARGLFLIPGAPGTAAVIYGLWKPNDPVFVIGIVLFVFAYLILRRELKRFH